MELKKEHYDLGIAANKALLPFGFLLSLLKCAFKFWHTTTMNENKLYSELGLSIPVSQNVKPRFKKNKIY